MSWSPGAPNASATPPEGSFKALKRAENMLGAVLVPMNQLASPGQPWPKPDDTCVLGPAPAGGGRGSFGVHSLGGQWGNVRATLDGFTSSLPRLQLWHTAGGVAGLDGPGLLLENTGALRCIPLPHEGKRPSTSGKESGGGRMHSAGAHCTDSTGPCQHQLPCAPAARSARTSGKASTSSNWWAAPRRSLSRRPPQMHLSLQMLLRLEQPRSRRGVSFLLRLHCPKERTSTEACECSRVEPNQTKGPNTSIFFIALFMFVHTFFLKFN